MKSRTSLFVIGFMVAMIAASLLTVLILFMTGAIATNPIELEFTVEAVESKEYDGTPLRATHYAWNSGQLKEGHRIEARILGSQTDCGTSESDLLVKVFDSDGRETTDEYSVKVHKGELTVTPKSITVMLRSQQIPYSGKEIPIENYEIFNGTGLTGNPDDLPRGSLAEGHTLSISFPGRFENVGDKLPDISEWSSDNFKIYDEAGRNVTYNYHMGLALYGLGDIEIVPRRLKVKALDVEKYYDGKPVEGRYEIVSGSLVEGHFIGEVEYEKASGGAASVVTAEDSTDVKVSRIVVYKQEGFNLVPLTEEEHKNYVLEGGAEVFGKHSVLRRPVTVSAKDLVKLYDGLPLSSLLTDADKPYTTDLPEPYTLSVTADFSVSDVYDGVYSFQTVTVADEDGVDVTGQFEITTRSGTARILPIKIQSSLNQLASVAYTGTEIAVPQSDLTDGIFLESIENYIAANESLDDNMASKLRALGEHVTEFFDVVCDKTIKNADRYRLTLELNAYGAAQFGRAGNVTFDFAPTTFTVGKAEIGSAYATTTVTAVYDGTEVELDYRNLTLTGGEGYYDATLLQVFSADFKYADAANDHSVVGVYTVRISNVRICNGNTSEDVTQNFNVTAPGDVTVRITPRTAYLVVGQAYATYETDAEPTEDEGSELANELVQQFRSSVSIQGLAAGDVVGNEDFDFSPVYDSSTLTVTIYVSLGMVRNAHGQNVLPCYSVDNDASITIKIIVKTA